MKSFLISSFIATAAADLAGEFKAWQQAHGKMYASASDRAARLAVWTANRDFVNAHNAKFFAGRTSFRMRLNSLGDLSHEEYKTTMLGGARALHFEVGAQVITSATAPDSFDLRSTGVVVPVKDQGQCGSCWAFSAVAAMEGAYNKNSNGTVPPDCAYTCGPSATPCCSFSEQELVDCVADGKDTCNTGGSPADGVNYVSGTKKGLVSTETEYKYTSGGGTSSGKCRTPTTGGVATGITGFAQVKQGDEAGAKEAVYAHSTLSIGIDASQQSFQFYSSGVYIEEACKNGPDDLDHGVAIVGYGLSSGPPGPAPSPYPDCVGNADAAHCEAAPKCHWCADAFFCSNDPCAASSAQRAAPVASGNGTMTAYWIVRNSWAASWGMDGYILMAKDRDNQCGVATNAIWATM